jgi:hypothetical protein
VSVAENLDCSKAFASHPSRSLGANTKSKTDHNNGLQQILARTLNIKFYQNLSWEEN